MRDWYDDYQDYRRQTWRPMRLSANDEQRFREDMKRTKWFRQIADDVAMSGEEISDDDILEELVGANADYDYRRAWANGAAPSDYAYDEERQHWPSSLPDGTMLKSPQHPTSWMEYYMRETGVDPVSQGLRTPEEAREYSRQQQRMR